MYPLPNFLFIIFEIVFKKNKSILNFAPISSLKVLSSFVNLPLCLNLRLGKASSLK
jgi:hypothetical protein